VSSDEIAQAEGSDRRRSVRGAGEESVRMRLKLRGEEWVWGKDKWKEFKDKSWKGYYW